jgi:hypothetical protein
MGLNLSLQCYWLATDCLSLGIAFTFNYVQGRSRCVGLTTLPPSCADCLEIWEPQPPGTLRVCQGMYWDWFTFTLHSRSVGTWWSCWLRHCTTNRKVAGSIPDGVIGIFLGHTLGLTQPLREMSTRNIFWGSHRADNLATVTCRLS